MDKINTFVSELNGYLFSETVIYILLLSGLVFTIFTLFGQWRSVTHGVEVVRGKYNEKDDPGAISHFQALATALSATVGLGNIAGVGLAVALGGPGAVFWMWVIGILGMALKMTEVTQSMLFRNTADPENPHGGPMFVAKYGFERAGLPMVGSIVGGIFVVTLLVSAITGGNMFQAWNVAETTTTYFGDVQYVSRINVGIVLALITGIVIIGGIRWIGRVAGVIVPFMCVIYLIAALFVLAVNITEIPSMLWLIVKYGLGIDSTADASGAFLGGTFGYALMFGVKRALFSSEAGQGSSPIAHAAAKTDEPVREGIVAGLEPLIDTLVVCTITALVILSTGAWNRGPEATFASADEIEVVAVDADNNGEQDLENGKPLWTLSTFGTLPAKSDEARKTDALKEGEFDYRPGESFFVVVDADDNVDTARSLERIPGSMPKGVAASEGDAGDNAEAAEPAAPQWGTLASSKKPILVGVEGDENAVAGLYGDYKGSTLTAHAFDRVYPQLGKYLVTLAVWLFAISTIISWSYYGEQGMVFLTAWLGDGASKAAILVYKLLYCGIIIITCLDIEGWLDTDASLDMWTTLGLGVMLVVNIPLMWLFAMQAMTAYHDYIKRYTGGPMHDEIVHEAESVDPGPPAPTL